MPNDFVRSLSVLGLTRRTGDEQDFELVPNKEGRFVGAMVRTNRWGMRDRDYSLQRPANIVSHRSARAVDRDGFRCGGTRVIRGAARGASQSASCGHDHSTTFEILNFGVAGYSPLHMLYQLERKVFAFEPNMALFLGHVERLRGHHSSMGEDGAERPSSARSLS